MISDFCSAFRAIDLLQSPLWAPIPLSTLSVEGGYSTRTIGAAPRFPCFRALFRKTAARRFRRSSEHHPARSEPAFRQHFAYPDEPLASIIDPYQTHRPARRGRQGLAVQQPLRALRRELERRPARERSLRRQQPPIERLRPLLGIELEPLEADHV